MIGRDMNKSPYIHLPEDHYAHVSVAAEWWWLVGTLQCGERKFGVEVDATGFMPDSMQPGMLVSFLMLSDVLTGKHYQHLTPFAMAKGWAQTNPAERWHVQVGASGTSGHIAMDAAPGNPLSMHISAGFADADSKVAISIKLHIEQSQAPLLVWGDGRSPKPIVATTSSAIDQYIYYYSLTDLRTTGTLMVGSDTYAVTGVTWMDHQYGGWAKSYTWALQDIQLDNGIRLSNFTDPNVKLIDNHPVPSHVTVLWQDGKSTYHASSVTPASPPWQGPSGTVYFPHILVEIPELNASLTVRSLIPNQEIWNKELANSQIYEGVAFAEGFFDGKRCSGHAWNEQSLL